MPGRKGQSKPWKVVRQTLPKVPSMDGVHRITLPSGRVIDWRRIHRDYNEQMEGQLYDRDQIAADLQKKRAAFEEVATATWLTRQGFSPHVTGKILGELPSDGEYPRERNGITIKTWMSGDLPPPISLKKHTYHQRSRARVRLRASNKYGMGYILGLRAVNGIKVYVNQQTGKTRLGVHTTSEAVTEEFGRAVKGTFGLPIWVYKFTEKRPGERRQRLRATVESTNLTRFFSGILRNGLPVLDYLPNSPKARLGFLRAVCDKGNIHVDIWKNSRRVMIIHKDPKVLDLISRTLQERGIQHKISSTRGSKGIHIPNEALPAFKRIVGFRDSKKYDKLPD